MKRLLIVVAVAALSLTAVPVALAGQGQGGPSGATKAKNKAFVCNGKVQSVDLTANTITIRVWSGSQNLRKFRGKELTVAVSDTTKITTRAFGQWKVATIDAIKAGQRIWTWGTAVRSDDGTTYTARRVRAHATWPFSAKGTVTSLASPDLTVKVTSGMIATRPYVGSEVVFPTTADTLFRECTDGVCTTITFADVVIGDKVVVGGTIDNTTDTPTFIVKRVIVRN